MQKISDELVEKFLSGLCSPEEAAMVWEYLQDQQGQDYLLHEFEQTNGEMPLPRGYREEMLAYIRMGMEEDRQRNLTESGITLVPEIQEMAERRKIRPFRRWAAAAAVILATGGWLMLQHGRKGNKGDQLAAEIHTKAPAFAWVNVYNDGKKEKTLILPDSSKVRLLPGTRLYYRKDFGPHTGREVAVEGKVWFDVAKNGEMPFTVYSDGMQTTVLGTVFEVTDKKSCDKIKVKLYEGKVLVCLEEDRTGNESKDYYLSPGQELVFVRSTRNVAINSFGGTHEEQVVRAHVAAPDTISNWYMFNNQTLANVFDQLSAIYNIDIDYTQEDIRKMYFIGKLEKKDSLNEILQDIALLNHLSVTNLNGKYIVRKRRP